MEDFEIIKLSKDEWKGTPVPMNYMTDGYFDVEVRESADSFHIDIEKKHYETQQMHYCDFPDFLFADWWEGAEAWGIVSAENELLACIECCPEEWSNRLMVTELWVSDKLQRQGIGTRLMDVVKEKAAKDGRRAIILETQSCNVRAIAFYQSQGFQMAGIDSCCYGNFDVRDHNVRFNLVYFIRPDIVRAEKEDLPEILELQYLAYQSEAALFGNKDIPPLKETLSELEHEFENGVVLKMIDENGRIIGSVRSTSDETTVYVGKLMVHPDHQKKGYGKKLLREIERYYLNKRFELFTSTRSKENIMLYEKMGYKKFKEEKVTDELVFVYLEKPKE